MAVACLSVRRERCAAPPRPLNARNSQPVPRATKLSEIPVRPFARPVHLAICKTQWSAIPLQARHRTASLGSHTIRIAIAVNRRPRGARPVLYIICARKDANCLRGNAQAGTFVISKLDNVFVKGEAISPVARRVSVSILRPANASLGDGQVTIVLQA